MTVLYSDQMMTDKEFYQFDPIKLQNRFRQQLKRSGFNNPVIGQIEFDYHSESERWLPHLHLIAMSDRDPTEVLRKRFFTKMKRENTGASVERPIHVVELKDKPEQISYICKSYCMRIDVYDDNGKRRTRKFRLKPSQLRLSLRVYDRIGFSGLSFLYKVRQRGNKLVVNAVSEK